MVETSWWTDADAEHRKAAVLLFALRYAKADADGFSQTASQIIRASARMADKEQDAESIIRRLPHGEQLRFAWNGFLRSVRHEDLAEIETLVQLERGADPFRHELRAMRPALNLLAIPTTLAAFGTSHAPRSFRLSREDHDFAVYAERSASPALIEQALLSHDAGGIPGVMEAVGLSAAEGILLTDQPEGQSLADISLMEVMRLATPESLRSTVAAIKELGLRGITVSTLHEAMLLNERGIAFLRLAPHGGEPEDSVLYATLSALEAPAARALADGGLPGTDPLEAAREIRTRFLHAVSEVYGPETSRDLARFHHEPRFSRNAASGKSALSLTL